MRNLVLTFFVAMGLALSTAAFAESAGQYIDDATVTAKVKTALMGDKKLKAANVSVQTNAGTVQLTGSVADADQEAEAVRVTNQVDGVKIVKDNLQVPAQEP